MNISDMTIYNTIHKAFKVEYPVSGIRDTPGFLITYNDLPEQNVDTVITDIILKIGGEVFIEIDFSGDGGFSGTLQHTGEDDVTFSRNTTGSGREYWGRRINISPMDRIKINGVSSSGTLRITATVKAVLYDIPSTLIQNNT